MLPYLPYDQGIAMRRYRRRVLSVNRQNLVAYWTLGEVLGSVAMDASGNSRNGSVTSATMGQPGIGDGSTSYKFDGTTSFVNAFSSSLQSAFPSAAGSAQIVAKVSGSGVWTDSTSRYMCRFRADANNALDLNRSATNGRMALTYTAGGTASQVLVNSLTTTDWMYWLVTWTKAGDAFKVYLNGTQQGTTQTGLGTWAGNINGTNSNIGSNTSTPTSVWSGWIAHVAIWNTVLTAADAFYLGVL